MIYHEELINFSPPFSRCILSGTKFALWYFPRILYSWYFYTTITRRTHQIDQKRVRFFYIRNFLFPWTATAINGVNGTCSSGSGQFVSTDSTTQLRPGVWRGEIVMLSTRLGILICLVHLTRWGGKKKCCPLFFHCDYNSQWEVKKMQAFDDSTPFFGWGGGRSVGLLVIINKSHTSMTLYSTAP